MSLKNGKRLNNSLRYKGLRSRKSVKNFDIDESSCVGVISENCQNFKLDIRKNGNRIYL